jgi:hypothetical protein
VLQELPAILVALGLPIKTIHDFLLFDDVFCTAPSMLRKICTCWGAREDLRSTPRFSSPKAKRLALLKPWGDAFHPDNTVNQL